MKIYIVWSIYILYLYFLTHTQILPGVKVIIANTETKGPLGDSHLGEVSFKSQKTTCDMLPAEPVILSLYYVLPCVVSWWDCIKKQIWVSSPHNATGYYTVYGEEALHADHFSTRLSFGDTQTVWARTGYLGFLRRTELTDASGGTVCMRWQPNTQAH